MVSRHAAHFTNTKRTIVNVFYLFARRLHLKRALSNLASYTVNNMYGELQNYWVARDQFKANTLAIA